MCCLADLAGACFLKIPDRGLFFVECSGKKVEVLDRVKFLMAANSISIRGRVVFKIKDAFFSL